MPLPDSLKKDLPLELDPITIQANPHLHYLLQLEPSTQEFFNDLVRNHMNEPYQIIQDLLTKIDGTKKQLREEKNQRIRTEAMLRISKEKYARIFKDREALKVNEVRLKKRLEKRKTPQMSNAEKNRFIVSTLKPYFTDCQISCYIEDIWVKKRWGETDYERAVILMKKSPEAYKYLRNKKILPLPCPSSMLRYLRKKAGLDGSKNSLANSDKICEFENLLKINYKSEDNDDDDEDLPTPLEPDESDFDEEELQNEIRKYKLNLIGIDEDEQMDDIEGNGSEEYEDPLDDQNASGLMEALVPNVEIKHETDS